VDVGDGSDVSDNYSQAIYHARTEQYPTLIRKVRNIPSIQRQ